MRQINLEHSGVHWERVGSSRVAVWPKGAQPDIASLSEYLSPGILAQISHVTHEARRGEWLATRVLSMWLTGQLPAKGGFGEPVWENGVRGSITHKGGHVALCFTNDPCVNCGVDIELSRDLDPGVRARIMSPGEWRLCEEIPDSGSGHSATDTLVFAAKEAIYKALFPRVGKVFWFEAAQLTELVISGEAAAMGFRICEDLSPVIGAGMLIRVDARFLILDGVRHWLAVATHARNGRVGL